MAVIQWRTDLGATAAPPGLGSSDTLLVATSAPPGQVRGISQVSANTIHGPFDTLTAQRAPVATGAEFFFVNTGGQIVRRNLAGERLDFAPLSLGRPGPLVIGTDDILRIGTNQRVLAVRTDGTTVFDVATTGAVDTAPAIDAAGHTYFALDTGLVIGIDSNGTEVFRQTIAGPASGPAVRGSQLAVGGLDGVYAFDTGSGEQVFRHARDARVVGTRWLGTGELLTWGEDSLVELLGPDGSVVFSFDAGVPVYTPVVPVPSDGFGVIDSMGRAYRVNRAGIAEDDATLGGTPSRQIAVTAEGWVAVAVGTEVVAVNFALNR